MLFDQLEDRRLLAFSPLDDGHSAVMDDGTFSKHVEVSDVSFGLPVSHSAPSSRIVGGSDADPGEYPWMVSLQDGNFHFCGGALVDAEWILTAAHCVVGSSPGDQDAVIGPHDLRPPGEGERISLDQIIVHPGYNSSTDDFDVALLHLDTPSAVTPIAMADSSQEDPLFLPGVDSTIIGWGDIAEGGPATDILQEVVIPIVSNADANAAYGGGVTDNMIAAGVPQGGLDSCQGDSGGPMMVDNGSGGLMHVGVVSWGIGCARLGLPGINAKTSNFTAWTDSIINAPPPVKDPFCAFVDANNDGLFSAVHGDVLLCGMEVKDGVFSTKHPEGSYATKIPGSGLVIPASTLGITADEINFESEGDLVIDANLTALVNDAKLESKKGNVVLDDPAITSPKKVQVKANKDFVATNGDTLMGKVVDIRADNMEIGGSTFSATNKVKLNASGHINVDSIAGTVIEATDANIGKVILKANDYIDVSASNIKAGRLIKIKAGTRVWSDDFATFIAFGSKGTVDIRARDFIDFYFSGVGGSVIQAVKRINIQSSTNYVDLRDATVAICDSGSGNTTGDIKKIKGTTVFVERTTIKSPDVLIVIGIKSGSPTEPILPGNGIVPCDC